MRESIILGLIIALGVVASARVVLLHRYAPVLRGKDLKDELHRVFMFARDKRIVGGIVIALWGLQYTLLIVLAVALIVK